MSRQSGSKTGHFNFNFLDKSELLSQNVSRFGLLNNPMVSWFRLLNCVGPAEADGW